MSEIAGWFLIVMIVLALNIADDHTWAKWKAAVLRREP